MSKTSPPRLVLSAESQADAAPYLAALRAVGAPPEALHVVQPDDPADAADSLAEAGGLLLCGGEDVEPWRYGEETIAEAGVATQPERDLLEWELLARARALRLPTLGICRGVQVVNAYLGGSLFQDLPLQRASPVSHQVSRPLDALAHRVTVADDGHPVVARLGAGALEVNSRHHQAIRALAPGLIDLGRAEDLLIEACALPQESGWWLVGVQWHPENLLEHTAHRGLFEEFLAAARAYEEDDD